MASNAWSMRRARIPRPIVCKSNDPYAKWPSAAFLAPRWFAMVGAGESSFTFGVFALRVPLTMSYAAAFVDDLGNPCIVNAVIPIRIGPVAEQVAAIIVNVTVLGEGPLLLTGRNEDWPNVVPFTSEAEPLELTGAGFGSGTWFYDFQV